MKLNIDSVAGIPAGSFAGRILRNTELTISGWAIDPVTRTSPAVFVRVDGVVQPLPANAVQRNDVARHFNDDALRQSGFSLTIRPDLDLGTHNIALGAKEDGVFAVSIQFSVVCIGSHQGGSQPWPRVLIAAAPKSGSTYTLSVLRTYFGTAHPPLENMFWAWEQNLDGWVLDRLRNRPFVMQMHTKPYDHQLTMMRSEAIIPVVTWRNLGDTIVSYDDHIRKQNLQGTDFMFYMDARSYLSMPDQERYRYLIAYVVPWYVNYYLGWRKDNAHLFMHYELLAEDPAEFFGQIITYVADTVDRVKLDASLTQRLGYAENRFNVGVNGRAATKMSDKTKGLLEAALRNHFEDLHDLIRELPWNEGARAALEPVIPR